MNVTNGFILLVVLLPWMAAVTTVRAESYSYVDDNGTMHLVNSLDKVPEKYRNNMTTMGRAMPASTNAPAPSSTTAKPSQPAGNTAARIGPGEISRKEYEFYQLKLGNRIGKTPKELTPEERKKALDDAINDELIFQAALAEGALNDSYIKWMMGSLYRSKHTTEQIDPRTFTEGELQTYYKAHPEEFTRPAAVNVNGIKLDYNAPPAQHDEILRKAKSNPASVPDWVELGWIEKGKVAVATRLPQDITNPLTNMKKGEVSNIIEDRGFHLKMIVWVKDRREPSLIPFAESRERARFLLIGEKQREMSSKLVSSASKGQPNQSEDEVLFQAALKAGMHRDIQVRQRIINTYASQKKTTKEQLVPQLKARFPVQILATD